MSHSTAAGIAAADKSHQTRPDKTALVVVVVVLSSLVDGLSAYEIFCWVWKSEQLVTPKTERMPN